MIRERLIGKGAMVGVLASLLLAFTGQAAAEDATTTVEATYVGEKACISCH